MCASLAHGLDKQQVVPGVSAHTADTPGNKSLMRSRRFDMRIVCLYLLK